MVLSIHLDPPTTEFVLKIVLAFFKNFFLFHFYLSINFFIQLCTGLFIYLFIYLSIISLIRQQQKRRLHFLFTCFCVYIHLKVWLSLYLYVCPFVFLRKCFLGSFFLSLLLLSVVCLFVCLGAISLLSLDSLNAFNCYFMFWFCNVIFYLTSFK